MVSPRSHAVRVSVVVPVLREGARLEPCLGALARQSLPAAAFEVIVVDGDSMDGTRERVQAHGFRFALDPGGCVSSARNRGVSLARGDVVAFTDGDCVPEEAWLERLLARFDADSRIGGVGGALGMERHGSALSRAEDWSTRAFYRGFITSNVAYRRSVVESVGGFDPALSCGEDWDLWWRVRDAGHLVVFEPSARVLHAPDELRTVRAYFARQFWYARHDVRTVVKRVRAIATARAHGRGDAARVWEVVQVMGPSWAPAAAWLALAATPFAPRSALATAGFVLGTQVVGRSVLAASRVEDARAGSLVGHFTLKYGVRGLGTLVGVADLLVDVVRAVASAGPRTLGAERVAIEDGEGREAPVTPAPVVTRALGSVAAVARGAS